MRISNGEIVSWDMNGSRESVKGNTESTGRRVGFPAAHWAECELCGGPVTIEDWHRGVSSCCEGNLVKPKGTYRLTYLGPD